VEPQIERTRSREQTRLSQLSQEQQPYRSADEVERKQKSDEDLVRRITPVDIDTDMLDTYMDLERNPNNLAQDHLNDGMRGQEDDDQMAGQVEEVRGSGSRRSRHATPPGRSHQNLPDDEELGPLIEKK
jgi:hypothetical protein